MAGQIVTDDQVARLQGRPQTLFDVGQEHLSVQRAIDQQRCRQPVVAQRGQQRRRAPVAVGHAIQTAAGPGGAAIPADQLGVQAGFIEKHEPAGVPLCLPQPPADALGLQPGPGLLGGAQRFL